MPLPHVFLSKSPLSILIHFLYKLLNQNFIFFQILRYFKISFEKDHLFIHLFFYVWGQDVLCGAINCFLKIRVVLKRTFKLFIEVVLKRTNWRQVQWFYCCLVLADC